MGQQLPEKQDAYVVQQSVGGYISPPGSPPPPFSPGAPPYQPQMGQPQYGQAQIVQIGQPQVGQLPQQPIGYRG
jgi:hypothetical protein